MERYAQIQKELGNERIVVPKAVPALTSRRVLTMERLHGIKLSEFERIRREVANAEELLLMSVRSWMQSFALYGFFHGDVHAGNFLLMSDDRVG